MAFVIELNIKGELVVGTSVVSLIERRATLTLIRDGHFDLATELLYLGFGHTKAVAHSLTMAIRDAIEAEDKPYVVQPGLDLAV